MQKVRGHTLLKAIVLPLIVGNRFQVLLTPISGYFSPFPHGTSSLSVSIKYLALDGGPPGFPQDFTCPVVLRIQSN